MRVNGLMKKFFLFLVAMFGLVMSGAAPAAVSANEINFAVIPNLPDNQVDKNHSYFDLELNPGQSQTVSVTLKNDTDKDVVVAMAMTRATTNTAGVVQYSSTSDKDLKSKLDKSYTNDIVKAVNVPDSQTIPAHSSIQVPITIKMPNQNFKGVMAGGITFKQTNLKQKKSSGQTNIVNQYAYTVGVTLRNNTDKVSPNLKLSGVTAEQLNYRTAIVASVHNTTPTYINNVAIDGYITKRNSSKKLYKLNVNADKANSGKQIAPNSVYDVPFYLGGDELKPGKYTLDLTMTSHGDKWHFKQNFTIVSKQAEKLNKTDVDIVKINWWLIAGIVGLIILLLILAYWLWQKKRNSNNETN